MKRLTSRPVVAAAPSGRATNLDFLPLCFSLFPKPRLLILVYFSIVRWSCERISLVCHLHAKSSAATTACKLRTSAFICAYERRVVPA